MVFPGVCEWYTMSESVQRSVQKPAATNGGLLKMATIGGNNYHQLMNNAAKSGAKTVAGQGLGGGISKQLKGNKTPKEKGLTKTGETVSPELAKALENAKNQDGAAAAKAEVADNAAQANAKKKDIGGGDDEDHRVGQGDLEKPKPGFVFVEGADDEQYQIKETEANQVARMDGKSFSEKLNADMPEGTKRASEATLNNQIETKGTDEVSKMKEGPKDFAVAVENMDLEPAEDAMAVGKIPMGIMTPNGKASGTGNSAPPQLQFDDEHNEKLAGDAAKKQMMAGAQEAFVA